MSPLPHERSSSSRHVLHIHHGEEDRLAGLVRGARAGLEAGELVLLVSDRPDVDDRTLRRALVDQGTPPEAALRCCACEELCSATAVRSLVEAAVAEGYQGLRVLQPLPLPSTAAGCYRERETALDELGAELPLSALCTYDALAAVAAGAPDGLQRAVSAHRHVVEPCLTLVTEPAAPEVEISLSGDIDVSNVEVLGWAVQAALGATGGPAGPPGRPGTDRLVPPVRRLVVDAAGVQVLSAAGFRVLVEATAPLRAAGGEVRLVGASPVVRRVADILATPAVPGLSVAGRGP